MNETFQLPAGPGRRIAHDDRDLLFQVARVIPTYVQLDDESRAAVERGWRYWNDKQDRLNQGLTGTCVGHAWVHLKENGPWTYPGTEDPFGLYRIAVGLDEWRENDHEATAPINQLQFGTSVRAGAKAAQKQGWAGTYRWAYTFDELVAWLLRKGPAVVGTWWYSSMVPENLAWKKDSLFLPVSGHRVGGHAYLATGINLRQEKIRFLNSWRSMEVFWLSFDDVDRLLFQEDGEICMSDEIGGR